MRAVPIVHMGPDWQVLGSALGGLVCASVGPFPEGGLDEALGLAVGLWRIGSGSDVPEAEFTTGVLEGEGSVARTVVGHDARDGDAEACVISDCRLEEGHGAGRRLIARDVGEGDAGGVVDADMDMLP